MTSPTLVSDQWPLQNFSAWPESTGPGGLIEWRQKSRIYWVIIVSTYWVCLWSGCVVYSLRHHPSQSVVYVYCLSWGAGSIPPSIHLELCSHKSQLTANRGHQVEEHRTKWLVAAVSESTVNWTWLLCLHSNHDHQHGRIALSKCPDRSPYYF